MKKIEAIIREEKLKDVRMALESAGFPSITVIDVKGRGAQGGLSLQWRVGEYRVDLLPKKMIMVVVADEDCDKVIDTICDYGSSGNAGDGKIFVTTVDEVIRVRTRETGLQAM
ncbi:MAG TPA: P-II family nitrogen regulator [Bacillota bacterium]|nr:P-II family nitrogen regulator [Bacillota bacterium]